MKNDDVEMCDEKMLRELLELDYLPTIAEPAIVEDITTKFLHINNHQAQLVPRLVGIGGGPCAGKNFLYAHMKSIGQLPTAAVLHDPDLVMQAIPQYQEDATQDPSAAFKKWELPARRLANEILLAALYRRLDIIYIRSFALADSLQFVHVAKMFGYQFDAHMIMCNIDVALARARMRENETKRHIPPEVLMQRHEAVLQLLADISDSADNYFLYKNNKDGQLPIRI